MRGKGKQLYMKIMLILLSEALAIVITDLVSKYIVPIKHTSISYIVCGAILAYAVVLVYDHFANKRRSRMQQELRNLSDVVLLRYNVSDRDHNNN